MILTMNTQADEPIMAMEIGREGGMSAAGRTLYPLIKTSYGKRLCLT